MPTEYEDTFVCPHCGAELPQTASFCRECGASDESGWGDDDSWVSVDGDQDTADELDYEDFLRREFPDHATRRDAKPLLLLAVALLVCVALILATVLF